MKMWTRRRLLRTSKTERKTNVAILQLVEEKKILLSIIRSKNGKMIKHLMRHPSITNIMEGKVNGRKSRGRPRRNDWNSWLQWALTLALKREEWKSIFSL